MMTEKDEHPYYYHIYTEFDILRIEIVLDLQQMFMYKSQRLFCWLIVQRQDYGL
jgi:hypothetical protein